MTSIVKHYRIRKDGSLEFIGNETTKVEDRPASPRRGYILDNETMLKIGDIAYNGRINPDDMETYELKI